MTHARRRSGSGTTARAKRPHRRWTSITSGSWNLLKCHVMIPRSVALAETSCKLSHNQIIITYLFSHGICRMPSLLKRSTIANVVDSDGRLVSRRSCLTDRRYRMRTAIRPSMKANELPLPWCEVHAPNFVPFTITCEYDWTAVATNGSPARQLPVFETRFTSVPQSFWRNSNTCR